MKRVEREMGVQFSAETAGAEGGQQSDDFIYLLYLYIYDGRVKNARLVSRP